MKFLRLIGILLLALAMAGALAWAVGALHYDGPGTWFTALNLVALAAALFLARRWRIRLGIFAGWFAIVLGWWLTIRPTNDSDWQPDVAELPWAEIDGDVVTLHNLRNCDYRTKDDYTPRWETRTLHLSQLTGIDMAINYWGSPWMAHPIVSFQFADAPPLCFSIETRKKTGQNYSAIGGLYRQYELIYIAADERDILRVRTNFREGEDVYLYRLTMGQAQVRERFLEYLRTLNAMRSKPRWYNAITTNCTTSIRHQHHGGEQVPWDWRMLVNGKGDELMFERGFLVTDGLSFDELKRRAHVNPDAIAAGSSPDFSRLIRVNRPGMGEKSPASATSPSPSLQTN